MHIAENSIPQILPSVRTGDDARVYANERMGGYIVLRGTDVHLTCFATGVAEIPFAYTWGVWTINRFEQLPDGNSSNYTISHLDEDTTVECRVENPLLEVGEHVASAQFVLHVVGE